MKTIIFIFLTFTLNAQSLWYVDRDSPSPGDATTWATAATDLGASAIWDNAARGDTVYISGGADSTTYPEMSQVSNKTLSGTGWLTIAPAWETGHNGDVYFVNIPGEGADLINFNNTDYIKITGLNLYFINPSDTSKSNCIYGGNSGTGSDYLWIDNCHLISSGQYCVGFRIRGKFNTITDCTFETLDNIWNYEQELIYFEGTSGHSGGYTITGNTFISRSASPVEEGDHPDMWQGGGFGDTDNPETVVANNFFYWNRPEAWCAAMLYTDGIPGNARILFYNNIMVQRLSGNVGDAGFYQFELRSNATYEASNLSIRLYNNTFIMAGYDAYGFTAFQTWNLFPNFADTLIMKNNLIVNSTVQGAITDYRNFNGGLSGDIEVYATYVDIDYNYYSNNKSNEDVFRTNFTDRNLTEWQNDLSYDLNSGFIAATSISFTALWDSTSPGTAYLTATGRDIGDDLTVECPECTTDFNGNPRTGSWDMGAIQFQGVTSWIPGLK